MQEHLLSKLLGNLITVVLPLAVLLTGIIWLYDFLVLRKPRQEKIAAAEKLFEKLPAEKREENEPYQTAMAAASQEPVVVEFSKSFFPVLFFVFFLRAFLFEPYQIPSGSMIPTLQIGDFIVVNKFTYGLRAPIINKTFVEINKPKRGDAMVFFPPHLEGIYYIKRVIGLPGDHIEIKNNVLFINGEEMKQDYLSTWQLPQCRGSGYVGTEMQEHLTGVDHKIHICAQPGDLGESGSWDVPAGHYFMMGDNRDNSADSRAWLDPVTHQPVPFVSEDRIVGKAVAVWMHWEEFFSVPRFSDMRWIQ